MKKFFFIFLFLTLNFYISDSFAFDDPLKSEDSITNLYSQIVSSDKCKMLDFKNEIDIYESIDFALCNNPQTHISWLSIRQQAATLGKSRSDYLPGISLSGSSGESNSDASVYSSNISTSIDWLLFDFGKREASVEAEYFALMQSNKEYDEEIEELTYSIIEAYNKLFSSEQAVLSAERAEESYKAAFDIAEEKHSLGLVPKADVLKADTQYAQSILDRQNAENTFLNNQGSFAQILNVSQGIEFNLKKPSIVLESDDIATNIDELIDSAIKNRPDIQSLIAKEESVKASYDVASKANMPSISAYGNLGRTYYTNESRDDSTSSSIGVKLSIPLFTGFEKSYNERSAKYAYEKIKYEQELLKREVEYQVWQAYNDLKTARKGVEVSNKLVASARESKDLTNGMYKTGLSDMLDVLQAESAFADAENEKILAEYNEIIAEYNLLKSVGSLTQKIKTVKE